MTIQLRTSNQVQLRFKATHLLCAVLTLLITQVWRSSDSANLLYKIGHGLTFDNAFIANFKNQSSEEEKVDNNIADNDDNGEIPLNITYRACCGLGHRLARQAAAYHLAVGLKLTKLNVFWVPSCGVNGLFAELFGTDYIPINKNIKISFPFEHGWLDRSTKTKTNSTEEEIAHWTISNEPPGYNRIPTGDGYKEQVYAEVAMYRTMMDMFVYKDRIKSFQQRHSFDNHTVIGLHVRHGNGETGDFSRKGRQMKVPEELWFANVASMLYNYIRIDARFQRKPPMIFLATDGPLRLQEMLSSCLNHEVPVVMFPQNRVEEGNGVSYDKNEKDCVGSWASQLIDMIILAQSDMVIAGQYSSFSESLPLSVQFDKVRKAERQDEAAERHGVFCEVGDDGSNMVCYDDYVEWVQRRSTIPLVGNASGSKHTFRYTTKFIDHNGMQNFLDDVKNLKCYPADRC
jgi:hypothetical protein